MPFHQTTHRYVTEERSVSFHHNGNFMFHVPLFDVKEYVLMLTTFSTLVPKCPNVNTFHYTGV